MLRGSSDFDSIPVAPESVSKTTLLVGHFANSFEVCFDGFEGAANTQQPIPFVFEQLCSKNRVCFCWDTIRVRESWYVWFWGFNPRPGTPLTR